MIDQKDHTQLVADLENLRIVAGSARKTVPQHEFSIQCYLRLKGLLNQLAPKSEKADGTATQ